MDEFFMCLCGPWRGSQPQYLSRGKAGHTWKVLSPSQVCHVLFPFGSRYIEVYVSRKHQMQRHMPYSRQELAYSRARREYESISEDRGWRDTAGSYAEGEISESLRVVSVPRGPFVSPHSLHMREGALQALVMVFPSIPQNCTGKEQKAPGRF